MSSNTARKLNLLRTVGRSQSHDDGLTQRAPGTIEDGDEEEMDDDIDIEKINKGIKFFSDNFFSMFVNMLTGNNNIKYNRNLYRIWSTSSRNASLSS